MVTYIITALSIILTTINAIFWHPINEISGIWRIPVFFIVFFLILLIVYWLISVIISLMINTKKDTGHVSGFLSRYYSLMLENICFLVGARIHKHGFKKVPKDTFLLVCNHLSNYDPISMTAALRNRSLAFISKEENFSIPIAHKFMSRIGYIPLDRSDIRSGAIVTKKAADLIASGETSVAVFPEGTRNRTDEVLLDFKPGCFKSALWAKKPLVVMVAKGTDNVKKRFLRKFTRIDLTVVRVFSYEEIKDMKTQEISDMVHQLMLDELTK